MRFCSQPPSSRASLMARKRYQAATRDPYSQAVIVTLDLDRSGLIETPRYGSLRSQG